MDQINDTQKAQENSSVLDDVGHNQAVKAALHLTIGHITEDVGNLHGVTFSKPVVATLAELINRQIEIYAIDLEAFAKHARRTTINCEDVKLLARRNPKLKETIKEFSDSFEASGSGVLKKGRKRKRKVEEPKVNKDGEVEVIDIDIS